MLGSVVVTLNAAVRQSVARTPGFKVRVNPVPFPLRIGSGRLPAILIIRHSITDRQSLPNKPGRRRWRVRCRPQGHVNILAQSLRTKEFEVSCHCPQGNISIVAHSLGSVLTWDILSCQQRQFATVRAHHLTPSGAADDSVAALERLAAARPQAAASTAAADADAAGAALPTPDTEAFV